VLRLGKPAAVVVTEVFANLAQAAARARGVDPIPMLVLPHPLEGRPAAALDQLAETVFAHAIALLAQPPPPGTAP